MTVILMTHFMWLVRHLWTPRFCQLE